MNQKGVFRLRLVNKKPRARERRKILTPSCNFNFPIPFASLVFLNPHRTILVYLFFELSDAFILALLKPLEIPFVNQFCHEFLCIFVSHPSREIEEPNKLKGRISKPRNKI